MCAAAEAAGTACAAGATVEGAGGAYAACAAYAVYAAAGGVGYAGTGAATPRDYIRASIRDAASAAFSTFAAAILVILIRGAERPSPLLRPLSLPRVSRFSQFDGSRRVEVSRDCTELYYFSENRGIEGG